MNKEKVERLLHDHIIMLKEDIKNLKTQMEMGEKIDSMTIKRLRIENKELKKMIEDYKIVAYKWEENARDD